MNSDQTLTQHVLRVIEECAEGASQPPEAGPRAGQWTEWDRGVLDGVRMLGVCIQAAMRDHAAQPATTAAAQPAAPAAVALPLTQKEILECVRSTGMVPPMGLTRDVGPYSITEPTYYLTRLVAAIERAHGIGAAPVAPADLGSQWTVIGPDGSRFAGETPHRAANAAGKHFSRLNFDPVKAQKMADLIARTQAENEAENARLLELHGSLNCPACGGSGHVGDVAPVAQQAAAQPVAPQATLSSWRFRFFGSSDWSYIDAGGAADRLRIGVIAPDGTRIQDADSHRVDWVPLYTRPATLVGLSDAQIYELVLKHWGHQLGAMQNALREYSRICERAMAEANGMELRERPGNGGAV